MTVRGVEFLQNWIEKNVTANDQGQERAAFLATECILEAARQGIIVPHMEEGGPTVATLIREAMISHKKATNAGN